jgi:CRP/FNR family transcriptional regulator, cyclic AMP receptor protein
LVENTPTQHAITPQTRNEHADRPERVWRARRDDSIGATCRDAKDSVRKEARMAPQESTDERLARIPLFEGLSKKQLSQVSSLMTLLDLKAGTVLARQGEIGREFLILLEGQVEVARDGKIIAVRGPGDFIGEIALLDNRPRTATVTARTDVVVEALNRGEFASLLAEAPELSAQVMATMARRLAALDRESNL